MAKNQTTTELDGLRKEIADLRLSVEDLEGKLLKDLATVHGSLIDYKRENNAAVAEMRGIFESALRRRP